jgi:transposase
MNAWTQAHLGWVKSAVRFDHAAPEATLLDYFHEVEHVADRVKRLEGAITAAIERRRFTCVL